MTRSELKKILEQNNEESRRYYRLFPTLYRDLLLWEAYVELLAFHKKNKIHAPANRARWTIQDRWAIGENTFYLIHRNLRNLCDDL